VENVGGVLSGEKAAALLKCRDEDENRKPVLSQSNRANRVPRGAKKLRAGSKGVSKMLLRTVRAGGIVPGSPIKILVKDTLVGGLPIAYSGAARRQEPLDAEGGQPRGRVVGVRGAALARAVGFLLAALRHLRPGPLKPRGRQSLLADQSVGLSGFRP
jgi:hypothetical protein